MTPEEIKAYTTADKWPEYTYYPTPIGMHHTTCCGVHEIYSIQGTASPAETLWGVATRYISGYNHYDQYAKRTAWYDPLRQLPFLMFTDHVDISWHGQRFADFIREKKLGELFESPVKRNPNSQNNIRLWVWQPDWEAVQRESGVSPPPKKQSILGATVEAVLRVAA